jgi:membrane protease YdiL (CAAX protease family)
MNNAGSSETHEAQRADADIRWVLAAGGVYFALVFLREPIAATLLNVSLPLTEANASNAGRYLIADLVARAPALAIALGVVFGSKVGSLRTALRLDPAYGSWLWPAAVLTILSGLALNATGLWPYAWRWGGNSARPMARLLLESGQEFPLSLWVIATVAVIPFIEECVFRFALLRALLRTTRSTTAAIVLTSLVFAIGHLGYAPSGHLDVQHVSVAFWALVMSVVLGWITVLRSGEIRTAIVIHGVRNALEMTTLLLSASVLATC